MYQANLTFHCDVRDAVQTSLGRLFKYHSKLKAIFSNFINHVIGVFWYIMIDEVLHKIWISALVFSFLGNCITIDYIAMGDKKLQTQDARYKHAQFNEVEGIGIFDLMYRMKIMYAQ